METSIKTRTARLKSKAAYIPWVLAGWHWVGELGTLSFVRDTARTVTGPPVISFLKDYGAATSTVIGVLWLGWLVVRPEKKEEEKPRDPFSGLEQRLDVIQGRLAPVESSARDARTDLTNLSQSLGEEFSKIRERLSTAELRESERKTEFEAWKRMASQTAESVSQRLGELERAT